ncbi:hypothetical protein ABTX15_32255 [Micromonospora sp. NPDC094482]|uniref:TetR/AcrR family transcriptional regulator n=1 Tax=unclassified Micromonospora TaxID=2617518 RepID=UPI0033289C7A
MNSRNGAFHHVGDQARYLPTLQGSFHNLLRDEFENAINQMPPGVERLLAASRAYLDVCLRHPGVRTPLLEIPADAPIADAVRAHDAQMAEICSADFRAMGWPQPLDAARLWVGIVAEGAFVEFDTGGSNDNLRAVLRWFLGCRQTQRG